MKWIGQHIWDFVSRFRSAVYFETNKIYLENPVAQGSDPDKFLTLGSDNAVTYRTGAEVLSDIGAASSASSITGVSITTDTGAGSKAEDTSGSADFSILGATGVGVTNSGTTITATAVPGEIDHDSLSNFVAAEHYRWDNDISGTATIHANNITDLHGAGVDGSANQLLTDDGDGSVTSESTLSYTPNTLTIGDTDGGQVIVTTPAHDDGMGAGLLLKAGSATAGQTDKSGGILALYSGQGTGTGADGEVRVYTSPAAGGTGTSLNGPVKVATFTNDSKLD